MPNFDKTGPMGQGPRTGRGRGNCVNGSSDKIGNEVVNNNTPRGNGLGQGRGRGMGNGPRRNLPQNCLTR